MTEPRFVCFYLMKPDPDRIHEVVPRHVSYWQGLRLVNYEGGPFADRTGGLIVFDAVDDVEAQQAADGDPFASEGLLEAHWVKRWIPE